MSKSHLPRLILEELRHHAPFTMGGAFFGVLFMLIFQKMPHEIEHTLFYILHPAHVFLSAVATASMYQMHICRQGEHRCNPWKLIAVGYIGSIGVATISDSIIPYFGEMILDLPHRHAHIGFLEAWWLVSSLSLAGIALAYFWPKTKIPHASHVLISTWASLLHIMMALGTSLSLPVILGITLFLFLAVWVPCCLSDIVFPLLFVKNPSLNHVHH